MTKPNPQEYVHDVVTGAFNEQLLSELFYSEEYRRHADEVFKLAFSEGNENIDPETLRWWHDALTNEQEQPDIELDAESEKKDGGEIYLIILTLFLIAYGIKYLID